MKKLIFLIILLSGQVTAQQKTTTSQTYAVPAAVSVNTSARIHPIHPDFWGTNFLFWVDDDSALMNGNILKSIKEVGMRVLRYPGGTVADNFHWKTNMLENSNMFPYEEGDAQSDFDEFMAVCRKTGAEPALVLNTETWAVKNDYSGGAHEAAEWIRYCKSRGFKVKYVEIGNETYWHPVLSAEEYGKLINVYADSLRQVDPNLIIGINGHWNTQFTGTKERIRSGSYDQLMTYRKNIKSRADYNRYTDFTKENTEMPITKGDRKWWETLARISGANVDMIIVHWYFAPSQLSMVTQRLSEVRALFANMHPHKKYLLNISEYNVTERTPESHMHLTEMLGAMLHAKTDITGLWPMRMKYKKPTLLDHATDQKSILFKIHKKLSTVMKGSLVESASGGQVPAFATNDGMTTTVVMTGSKIDRPTQVSVSINGQGIGNGSIWRISGNEFDYKIDEVKIKKGSAIQISPGEVLIATLE